MRVREDIGENAEGNADSIGTAAVRFVDVKPRELSRVGELVSCTRKRGKRIKIKKAARDLARIRIKERGEYFLGSGIDKKDINGEGAVGWKEIPLWGGGKDGRM
ncbi:hypothetical protein KQX54_003668 [Cotesia glomerata]|uniref:Uncharacterized protein n=1 Tax=Cotesia glomerata TaxID=32391 RepID=A0AAV7IIR1_COTGL|nr:hypothetical protein KQX54_003668 [Cotesia glomerata]